MFEWLPNPLVVPVGILIGILISAPVGPVNVLCIRRAIEFGVLGGLAAGLGAVLADGLIALAAALGVGAVSGLVETYRYVIQAIGGLALIVFAILLLRADRSVEVQVTDDLDRSSVAMIAGDLPKAFLLTITNPAAVLGLFAIFGGVSSFVEVRGKDRCLDDGGVNHGWSACVVGWLVLSDRHNQALGRHTLAQMGQSDRRRAVACIRSRVAARIGLGTLA